MAHTKILHKRVTSNGTGTTQYTVKQLDDDPSTNDGKFWKNLGTNGLSWSSSFPDAALSSNLTNYRLKKRISVKTDKSGGCLLYTSDAADE